jgi:diguanylate cyclase (GGDEF)-like protein/PAS domain S-box-containing protein
VVSKDKLNRLFIWLVIAVGSTTTAFSAYRLQLDRLDLRFALLALVTTLIGARITIKLPGVKSHVSISDTLIFLCVLLISGEAAILLAAAEAFAASLRCSRKTRTHLFNMAVMGGSTFCTVWVLRLLLGGTPDLKHIFSADFVVALSVMALVQYACNSMLVAVSVALQGELGIWTTWRRNFLWTSITYFAGASAAAVIAHFIQVIGFYAFVAITPIIAIIYFTYRTYLTNIETSTAQAERARQHVEELSRYIAEQDRISTALQESEEHFRTAFDYAAIGMALVSPQGQWLRVNHSLCSLVGYTEDELLRSDFQSLTHPQDLGTDLAHIYRMLAGEVHTCQIEKRFIHRDGTEVWVSSSVALVHDAHGEPLHFIFQIQDITERKRAEAAIHTLSLVDELTGLYNRRGFLAFSQQNLASVQRTNKALVVVYADLDGLKQINDTFGHQAGDRALLKTADILRETFRSSDVLARLGGDEFTVLATVEQDGGTESLIARLEQQVGDWNATKAVPYDLSISVGVAAMDRNNDSTIEELLARADKAMYENKRRRKAGLAPWPLNPPDGSIEVMA